MCVCVAMAMEMAHCVAVVILSYSLRLIKQLNLITVNLALIAVFPSPIQQRKAAQIHTPTKITECNLYIDTRYAML